MSREEVARIRRMELGVEHCRLEEWEQGLRYLADAFEQGLCKDKGAAVALSYLGYGLARRQHKVGEGLAMCKRAVKMEFYQPEVYLNLSRTLVLAGNRKAAVDVLKKGLKVDPGDSGLLMLRTQLGWRERPVLPFLRRTHPLNRFLGRFRHAWSSR
ncbi:MAG TPA: hypothetical protein VMT16_05555 [Thermoanaerobaculia bacterium]|nr:hypothetical protein [Thermoanaerobaculia bacterium]